MLSALVGLMLTTTPQVDAAAPPDPGSRFGIAAVLGVTAGTVTPAGIAGIGLRTGLLPRRDQTMFMPALTTQVGVSFGPGGLQPWLEERLELMAARPGGLLQPVVHGFVSLGTTLRPVVGAPLLPPLGGPAPFMRPYVALGGGWNWLPEKLSTFAFSGGVLLLGLLPVIFAGHLEVRLTPSLRPGESTDVALVAGLGF
ncbi:MAG: hypothetical protein IPJ65_39415 [Archangiaceae bacterium]|nr:hypothetical protein [Archangiaceae bacterium]